MKARGWPVVLLLLSACTFGTPGFTGVEILCAADTDCPKPTVCRVTIQRCVNPDEVDNVGPKPISDPSFDPALVGPGDTLRVTVVFDEVLGAAPVLVIRKDGVRIEIETDQGHEGSSTSFSFRYTVDEQDVGAVVSVEASDRWGNMLVTDLGDLPLDATAPSVVGPTWVDAPAIAGAEHLVSFEATADLDAVVEVATISDQDNNGLGVAPVFAEADTDAPSPYVRLRGEIDLSLLDLTGVTSISVFLSVSDGVGNRVAPNPGTTALPVDAVPPEISITPNLVAGSMRASFSLSSTEDGATFECALDGAELEPCTATFSAALLDSGEHTFEAVSVDGVGLRTPVPATHTWSDTRRWERLPAEFSTTNGCVIASDESLWCWGSAEYGVLGTGGLSRTSAKVPQRVGTGQDWKTVSLGTLSGGFACGLRGDEGSLWCWGKGEKGQLAMGLTRHVLSPTHTGHQGWAQLSAGNGPLCAIRSDDRSLWCWGINTFGQLGDDSTEQKSSPTQVAEAGPWKRVAAGANHTCAAKQDNTVWCWGNRSNDALGATYGSNQLVPVMVPNLPALAEVLDVAVANGAGCVLVKPDTDVELRCWGQTHDATDVIAPPIPSDSEAWAALLGTDAGFCAQRTNGNLSCWGKWDGMFFAPFFAQKTTTWDSTLRQVDFGVSLGNVGASAKHICAQGDDGLLYCRGDNRYGQLGGGITSEDFEIVALPDTYLWSHIGLSDDLACAIGSATAGQPGELLCWGTTAFNYALFAEGAYAHWATPTLIGAENDWVVAAVGDMPWAVRRLPDSTTELHHWRSTGGTQISSDSAAEDAWTQASAGRDSGGGSAAACFSAGPLADGNDGLWCQGDSVRPSFGRMTHADWAGGQSWLRVAAYGNYACAIGIDVKVAGRSLWCWGGSLWSSFLGVTGVYDLEQIGTAVNWLDVSLGGGSGACGIQGTQAGGGTLWCWGSDILLGGTGDNQINTPTQLSWSGEPTVDAWTRVAMYGQSACAIDTLGDVYCWGGNGGRIHADPTQSVVFPPQKIEGVAGVQHIRASPRTTCAWSDDGAAWCFGKTGKGQLGGGAPWGPTTIAVP